MKYIKFLECEDFAHDFEMFCYCDVTMIKTFDQDDFHQPCEELIDTLVEFFIKSCDINITTVFNYPLSYIVNFGDKQVEYYNTQTMFTDLLFFVYGHTTKF
ncbi:hypothetical protein HYO65_gp032 [Tenacibaculum phage PTm1]|uniref:Uncharacterized protein n=2 Tax=Shirahamavirus PTm1 TaxID=2846435 RepID=A0A5S9HXC5_9CAUD|nr:hypothetical protein HYO65_gp032 [Tenacibaculum phage PTm1]BBI90424.1 hypothetical protein [Tenacibaculum phage PTm1]BBI90731.1 hypothetical protein [Tenacibaculum phage PTm5]